MLISFPPFYNDLQSNNDIQLYLVFLTKYEAFYLQNCFLLTTSNKTGAISIFNFNIED